MSDGVRQPVDLTQERYRRFAEALDSLLSHQKSLATSLAAGLRDVNLRLDRVENRLGRVEDGVGRLEAEVRELRSEQISHYNDVLTAQQHTFRANIRLDEIEEERRGPPNG